MIQRKIQKKSKINYKIFDLDRGKFLPIKEYKDLINLRIKEFNESLTKEDLKEGLKINSFDVGEDLFFNKFDEYIIIKGVFFDRFGSWVKCNFSVFKYWFGFEERVKAINYLKAVERRIKKIDKAIKVYSRFSQNDVKRLESKKKLFLKEVFKK